MALTACRECAGQVSTAAKACPHCGVLRPDRTQAQRGMTADVVRAALIAAVLLAVVALTVTALGV